MYEIIDFKRISAQAKVSYKLLLTMLGISVLLGGWYAFSLPNEYTSEVLLVSSDEEADPSSMLTGGMSGLASLAGVDFLGGRSKKSEIAVAMLTSKRFVMNFIREHELLVPIIAANGWDPESNEILLDARLFDEKNNEWVRKASLPKKKIPSLLEAYEKFEKRLSVSVDKKTSFVTVKLTSFSPFESQRWLSWMVDDINKEMRRRAISEADESIKYLEERVTKTSFSEMRTVFFRLIEEQTKMKMMAEVRREFVFKQLDPPLVPEKKSSPNRMAILIFSVIIGMSISFVYIILKCIRSLNTE